MAFERACALARWPRTRRCAVDVGRYDVAVARDGDEVFALQDLCSHAKVALSEGEVDDCRRVLAARLPFDLRTGKPTGLPATEPVATFPVEVTEDDGLRRHHHHPERSLPTET